MGRRLKSVREWGYDTAERAAKLLMQTASDSKTILDAGAGNGLSGMALRQVGFERDDYRRGRFQWNASSCQPTWMLQFYAISRSKSTSFSWNRLVWCYHMLFAPWPTSIRHPRHLKNLFVSQKVEVIFVTPTVPSKLKNWEAKEKSLEDEGKWKLVATIGPVPYLPDNPRIRKQGAGILVSLSNLRFYVSGYSKWILLRRAQNVAAGGK